MMRQRERTPLISVIVPVYNVETYLDKCISSITGQTYDNLEIILVNDGSTDGSGAICESWQKRDRRIKYMARSNAGQAKTRNYALKMCSGGLVTFVDSDDWIDAGMIEKLYAAMERQDADIAMCEAYTENAEGEFSGFSLQRLEEECIWMQKNKEYLLSVRYTFWSKLYKKSLFTEYNIEEPDIKFEDFATVPVLYALSEKIACVDEALYFYRYREQSTVRAVSCIFDRLLALQSLIDLFHRQKLHDGWEEILQRICTERGLILMRQGYPLLAKTFQKFCKEYDALLNRNFHLRLADISPRFHDQCKRGIVNARLLGAYNLAVFGSYNLMIAAKIMMNLGLPDFMENHDCFSGLVSAMSGAPEQFFKWNLAHKNAFREKHIIQDITKTFAHKSPCVYRNIDYYLVDFLEERYDIAEYRGCYFTLSDAFMDIRENIADDYRVIRRCSMEAKQLWERSCLLFIEKLRTYVGGNKVILVRMLLCEKYGTNEEDGQEYGQIDHIRRINAVLNSCYDFFEAHMPEADVVDMSEMAVYTDKNYRHGCYPWHLNKKAYWDLNIRILSKIKCKDSAAIDVRLKEDVRKYWGGKKPDKAGEDCRNGGDGLPKDTEGDRGCRQSR